uniref:B box-type domain-containing protein n=1 Tax=Leersia perrieri TaxID=77586 RepID=A0A0D9VB77_9ORYZ
MVIIDGDGHGDGDGDAAPCDSCRARRAIVHCAEHRARLCLLCDLAVHRHVQAYAHRRAPLCDACLAAPAVARRDGDLCALCAACASAGGEQCCHRPATTYTGVPGPDEMAQILSLPPPPIADDDTIEHDDIDMMNYLNYYPEEG